MKTTLLVAVLLITGCAEVNMATRYENNKPVKLDGSIPELGIELLYVYQDEKYPGRVWVTTNPGRKMSAAWTGKQNQFAAMYPSKVAPAYRKAALEALNAGGKSCTVDEGVPYPNQFAVEYKFTCT